MNATQGHTTPSLHFNQSVIDVTCILTTSIRSAPSRQDCRMQHLAAGESNASYFQTVSSRSSFMAPSTAGIKCIDHSPLLVMLLAQEKFVLPAVFSIPICIGLARELVKFPSITIGVLIVSVWPSYCARTFDCLLPLSFKFIFGISRIGYVQALLPLDFNREHNILILFQRDSQPTSCCYHPSKLHSITPSPTRSTTIPTRQGICLQCLTDSWESHTGLDTLTACGPRVSVVIITSLAASRVSTTLLQPSNRPMKCSQRSKSTSAARASKSPFRQHKNKTLPRSVPGQSKDCCGLRSYSDMRPWKTIVILPDN
jgi:hypothetical protein